ncbi:unnamed protein product [Phytomonas sp. EM1]|nr:unnamed protein product [Phytomonas sp. EM1]|eukprot:CCW63064.1 unnamed protein product [Phytomonas sp. isolate EM1]
MLVRRVIEIRAAFIRRLSHTFLLSNTTVGGKKGSSDPCSSILRPHLAIARLFPLFGLAVRVVWINWGDPNRDDARKSSDSLSRVIAECEFGRITIAACEKGVVLHESKNRLGIVLLPHSARFERMLACGSPTQRADEASQESHMPAPNGAEMLPTIARNYTPKVVQVRKFFPGCSGSETDLIQKLLLFINRRVQKRNAPSGGRMVVTMVAGEVGSMLPRSTDPNLLDCLGNRFL